MWSWFKQLSVLRSHGHRVDDDLVGGAGDEYDDLEQVAGAVGTDDEPPIGVLAEVVNDKRVGDRMQDFIVVSAVTSSRAMDLHTSESYYEIDRVVRNVWALNAETRPNWPHDAERMARRSDNEAVRVISQVAQGYSHNPDPHARPRRARSCGESNPPALSEPCVNLSTHTAPTIEHRHGNRPRRDPPGDDSVDRFGELAQRGLTATMQPPVPDLGSD